MADRSEGRHRHFILEGVTETEAYRYPGRGDGGAAIPEQDRVRHGGALQRQIDGLRGESRIRTGSPAERRDGGRFGSAGGVRELP